MWSRHTVFPLPLLAICCCSLLGAVPNKSADICIVNDLSWSVKKSVNEFVSPDHFSLTYTSIDTAVWHIQLFDNHNITKKDIVSASTHIIVHSIDWHLLGFKWQNNYYFSMILVFGCHSWPYLYNKFTDALLYMAKNRGSSELLDHDVDDSFTIKSSAKFLSTHLWK